MKEFEYVACNFCDEIRLVDHMDIEDETEKIYCQSDFCKEHFNKKLGAKMDVISFLGEQPWACSYCWYHKDACQKGACDRGRELSFNSCGVGERP